MTTAFISHRDCKLHDMGAQHPECPARLDAIHDQLIASGLDAYLTPIEAPLATMDQLRRVHPPDYIAYIHANNPVHGIVHLDPDTAMSPGTWQAALRAAGAGCEAVDRIMRGEVDNAFLCCASARSSCERSTGDGLLFF